ncbi:chromate transporter [Paenibacillus sp. GCM10012307]|uniref:Chromate transporter n=1 Tax=Paenibacillus roseus TaxID=2798579 RepID=A0A934MPT3_9BACL|nr:chromate transporter [Paenibacillus roseus]MBJ6362411.1 chromate transporter [Paenibacillus roseus]
MEAATRKKRTERLRAVMEILAVSTKLGLTSFGGPAAHLGYFYNEYIKRRQWIDDRNYADLVALCQFLPGPASSQVGIVIGVMRAGLLGGIAAWIGFTLPSVIALVLFAHLIQGFDVAQAGWVHGLKLVAVAIVAQAVLSMGQKLAPDRNRATIAILAMAFVLLWPTAWSQIVAMFLAAISGMILYKGNGDAGLPAIRVPVRRSIAAGSLILFVVLLIFLPLLANSGSSHWLSVFDSFYRSGSLVFGGGHVVLPLLEREAVPAGWLSKEEFLAGYGAAQAVPGPLFTFAAYLGALMGGWFGALVATLGIFLPAFLLVVGALPFWDMLRKKPSIQGALAGVNAAVVGILIAALYNPIWTSTIADGIDFAMAAILFAGLTFWKAPPWLVVIIGALGGWLASVL